MSEWLSVTLTREGIEDKESLQGFKTLAALKFPGLFDSADEVHDGKNNVNLQIPDGYVTDTDDDLIIEGGRSEDFTFSILELSGALECNVNIEYLYDDNDTHAEIDVRRGTLVDYRKKELAVQDVSRYNAKREIEAKIQNV